ncbi:MAG TPA: DUF1697 domain-containing protein [Verrucomicrobiae bacterium]|nr:DUF1697 domain-containing protein [Verrucomicrobiae bacterium]
MKYVALLRGINVGGNNIIKMIKLKASFEKTGFKNVITYIQSGNVIFESAEKNIPKLERKIEKALSKEFKYNSRVVVRSQAQLKKVLAEIPSDWKKRTDLRCNVCFVKAPLNAQEVLKEIELKQGVDFVKTGKGVVYTSTLMNSLTQSKFSKLVMKKVYQFITIRNLNTTQKLVALMEKQ